MSQSEKRILPTRICNIASGLFCLLVLADAASASILWADWTSAATGFGGSASGVISSSSPIGLLYTGEVAAATQTNGGTNYWIPNAPYLSGTVPNEPPAADIVALSGGWGISSRIDFSEPVTNPLMAIVSLGTPNITVSYHFDRPFDVLSYGPGYWPGPGTLTELPGNVLSGVEGHGAIQFQGTFSSIGWTIPTGEYWNGFTIGLLPEPTSIVLLLLGISTLAVLRRKR